MVTSRSAGNLKTYYSCIHIGLGVWTTEKLKKLNLPKADWIEAGFSFNNRPKELRIHLPDPSHRAIILIIQKQWLVHDKSGVYNF